MRLMKLQRLHNFLSNPNIWFWIIKDYRIVAEAITEGLHDEGFDNISYDNNNHEISLIAHTHPWKISIGLHSLAGTEKCVCLIGRGVKNFHKLDIRRFKSLYTLSRKIAKILKAGKK